MGKKFISSEDAVQAKCQHTTPCSDCPWRRDSLNGWLGGASKEEWIQVAHGDQVVPCHTLKGAQCAGLAVYRANVAKLPYPPNLKLPKDKELVFAMPNQFLEHHSRLPGVADISED
jgi:hypothetical protein